MRDWTAIVDPQPSCAVCGAPHSLGGVCNRNHDRNQAVQQIAWEAVCSEGRGLSIRAITRVHRETVRKYLKADALRESSSGHVESIVVCYSRKLDR